jgi:hypothetical protein
MIRKLHETLGIPSEVLIRDYWLRVYCNSMWCVLGNSPNGYRLICPAT